MQGTTNEVSGQFAPESIEYLLSMIDQLGSDRTYNHYPVGWAHAMDTPFQWTKQVASHFGGTRNGLAISWPKRIKAQGEIRTQFHHVIDIVPTILEAAGIQAPLTTQRHPAEADGRRQHGLHVRRREGPDAAHDPVFRDHGQPRDLPRRLDRQHHAAPDALADSRAWRPTRTNSRGNFTTSPTDFSQSKNLAKENPKKLARSASPFPDGGGQVQRAAHRFQLRRSHGPGDAPQPHPRRDGLHILPGHDSHSGSELSRHEEQVVPHHRRGGDPDKAAPTACWRRRADGSAAGLARARRQADVRLRLLESGRRASTRSNGRTRPASPARDKLAPGKHTIAFDFVYDGGGIGKGGQGTLTVDGKKVAEGRIEKTNPLRKFSLDESFDVGQDTGTPVIDEYDAKMPFQFTGTLARIQIHLSPSKLTPAQTSEINRQSKDFGLAVQ